MAFLGAGAVSSSFDSSTVRGLDPGLDTDLHQILDDLTLKLGTTHLARAEQVLWNHFPASDKNGHRISIIFNPAFLLTSSIHASHE